MKCRVQYCHFVNNHISGLLQTSRFAAVGSISPTQKSAATATILEMGGIEEKVHDVLKPLEGHLRPGESREHWWFWMEMGIEWDRIINHYFFPTQGYRIVRCQKNDDMELYMNNLGDQTK